MARQRTVGGLATGLVIAALVATGSAAHADPLTGTPTPSTSSSGSSPSSLAAEGDASASGSTAMMPLA